MAQLSRTIHRANAILARYGYAQPSIPLLSWCYSDPDIWDSIAPPLWFVSHVFTSDGRGVEYDYICSCGVNKTIHSPTCHSMIIPRIRLEKTKSAPTISQSWVLCRWIAPPSPSFWMEFYNTLENYPTRGRYIPLANNGHQVFFHSSSPLILDLPRISELVLQMMKEHSILKDQIEREREHQEELRDWTMPLRPSLSRPGEMVPDTWNRPPAGSKFATNRDRFRDSMTEFGQAPGKKGHVSWGGIGISPNVAAAAHRALNPPDQKPTIVLPST